MIGLLQVYLLSVALLTGCNDAAPMEGKAMLKAPNEIKEVKTGKRHFEGAFSNGMKGDSISFDISGDGKKLENLTFKGYWRCSGRLERTTVGPDGAFNILANQVKDHISEPPNGGSTAWRFDLEAVINGNTASGNFRMNINNLGCDTYKLKWTAREISRIKPKGK